MARAESKTRRELPVCSERRSGRITTRREPLLLHKELPVGKKPIITTPSIA